MVSTIPARYDYEFGPFVVDVQNGTLLRDGQPVPLTPKAFDCLVMLLEQCGRVVGKDEMIQRLWPNIFIEEGTLVQNIFTLRKALGDDKTEPSYIKTVPKRGYCFVGEVSIPGGREDFIIQESSTSSVFIKEEIVEQRDERRVVGGFVFHHRTAVLVISVIAFAIIGGLVYRFVAAREVTRAAPFQHIGITRLTTEGRVVSAAISPDGKYIAYVLDEPGRLSLWVKQTDVTNSIQLVPPEDVRYEELTFSRDSNWIYYVRDEDLYQTPTLGGVSRKLVSGVGSPVSLSPDGKRISFVRSITATGDSSLILANSGGTGEVTLASRKAPDYYRAPAWSPNGETIACSVGTRGDASTMSVATISVLTGKEQSLMRPIWSSTGQVVWLSDGSGLIVPGRENQSKASQLWLISFPDGAVRELTSGLGDYHSASITADGKQVVTVQKSKTTSLWIVDLSLPIQISRLTRDTGNEENPCFTPDGRIVFSSGPPGNRNIWISSADGSNRKQISFDLPQAYAPAVTSDGRFVVFVSEVGNTSSIWRTDVDGSNPKQLTRDAVDFDPSCTPDGKWVVFARYSVGKPTLWKIGIDGGEAIQLTDKLSRHPVVSPDGRQIACYYWDERRNSQTVLAILPVDGGEITRSFPSPNGMSPVEFRWTPDGSGLAYPVNSAGQSTIWIQPIAGGSPRRLHSFDGERVFFFDWSRDGRALVCSRGSNISDAVLISASP